MARGFSSTLQPIRVVLGGESSMKKASRRGLASLAVALVALAPASGMAATAPQLIKPVDMTKADLNPQRTYSAPYLLAKPDDPNVIVGGYIEFRARRCGIVRSLDA